MIIRSVHVKNFRCIRDETLPCDKLTVVVGANGSGKSAFLRALDMFYQPTARYEAEDFYGRETGQPILVTVTYGDLTQEKKASFRHYVENEELAVQKEMVWPSGRGSQKYYGMSLQNPDFEAFRAATRATERRPAYGELKALDKYASLPDWTNQDAAARALEDWEQANPGVCVRQRDDGQFFGFKEVGEARLERNTRFLFIPAVLEASEEAAEGRGTALSGLMDLVVRSVLSQREDVRRFQLDTQASYDKIMDPQNLPELRDLAERLNSTLRTCAPDAGVDLPWIAEEPIQIPMPRANPKLLEDEYSTAVERAGHGVQRAFLLTLLQHLAVAQTAVAEPDEDNEGGGRDRSATQGGGAGVSQAVMVPNLILGIEEPELYQHPNRQRHLSTVLLSLASGSIEGVAQHTQVIYTTHSPLFVDINRTDQMRVLRKVAGDNGQPKHTRVAHTSLDEAARVLEEADGKPPGTYSGENLKPRLVTLMTPWMNEGFFARVAVLVEGEQDRAAILGAAKRREPGAARRREPDFESMGVSVIPCNGKTNLDRPATIFRALRIPVYAIWDSDQRRDDAKPEVNRRLLRLFGEQPEDWPERVSDTFACFRHNIETTLRAEIGAQLFDQLLEEARAHFDFDSRERAVKCPHVMQRILEQAQANGKTSPTLSEIISKIVALA